MSQFQQEFITTVIKQYGLDLDGNQVDDIIMAWFQEYDPAWIMKAIVESLYRGRYKVKSVDNILKDWERRGIPLYQFTPDYEREILQSLPAMLALPMAAPTSSPLPDPPQLESKLSVIPSPEIDLRSFNTEKSELSLDRDRCILPDNSSSSQVGEIDLPTTQQSENLDRVHQSVVEPSNLSASSRRLPTIPKNKREPLKIDRMVPPPEKSYLFNTLKAIVEPTNRYKEEIQTSGQL
jgi:hypothetical protein